MGVAALVGAFTSTAHAAGGPTFVGVAADPAGGGWTAASNGVVDAFGGAPALGSMAGTRLNSPIVGIAADPAGTGYWLVAADGGIFSFGDARFYGSTGGMRLNRPVVGMAATSDGRGYWMVASDGGIFSFGDASFHGSTGGMRLNRPVVGLAATPDGGGYWMVASDGGIFSFGDAAFHGSMGGKAIGGQIVSIAVDSTTGGYWLLASDGGLFAFGAPFLGTATGHPLVGLVPTSGGTGYVEVDATGAVLPYGTASGSSGLPTPPQPPATPPVVGPQTAATPLSLSFGESNLFTRPVTNQPLDPNSASLVSNLVTQYQTYYGGIGVNQMPVFTVPASQPLVTVKVLSGCNNFIPSTGSQVPIPVGAYTTDPNYQHDSAIVISQPSTGSVWELWRATNNNDGTWSACWGGKLSPLTSSGVFPGTFGLSATGISYATTMITEADIASGSINHAIAMQVVRCNWTVAPAVRGDCGNDPGQPAEGTWFRMAPGTPMPAGMTPFGQMVFRALQTYGMVVTDRAGAVMLQAETAADWVNSGHTGADPMVTSWAGNPQYSALRNMPWSQLQVIVPPHN